MSSVDAFLGRREFAGGNTVSSLGLYRVAGGREAQGHKHGLKRYSLEFGVDGANL
jgi:hypothetical protein